MRYYCTLTAVMFMERALAIEIHKESNLPFANNTILNPFSLIENGQYNCVKFNCFALPTAIYTDGRHSTCSESVK